MKKSIFVALLVGVMVLAFAGTALAIGPVYITWSAAGANLNARGPHTNYQLTTEKCAVCHSVHAAAASNAAAGIFGAGATGAAETQMLLRTSVADACVFCHITTNTAGLQIYNGVATNYTVDDQYNHSNHAACSGCHAVHGADTFKGFIAGKILKANGNLVSNVSGGVQTEAATTLNAKVTAGTNVFGATAVTAGDVGDVQVTAFCTRCHKTFSDASEQTITASGYFAQWNGTKTFGMQSFKNHPLKAADAVFAANGATYTGTVAFADASTCRACHAAGDTRVSTSYGGTGGVVAWSFPHSTIGNAAFLPAGVGVNDTRIGILDDHSSATGKPATSNVVDVAGADGVCLRCHANGSETASGTAGVNITF